MPRTVYFRGPLTSRVLLLINPKSKLPNPTCMFNTHARHVRAKPLPSSKHGSFMCEHKTPPPPIPCFKYPLVSRSTQNVTLPIGGLDWWLPILFHKLGFKPPNLIIAEVPGKPANMSSDKFPLKPTGRMQNFLTQLEVTRNANQNCLSRMGRWLAEVIEGGKPRTRWPCENESGALKTSWAQVLFWEASLPLR